MKIKVSKTNKRNCYCCRQPIKEGEKYVLSWCFDEDDLKEEDFTYRDESEGYELPENAGIGRHFFHFPNCLPWVNRGDPFFGV